LGFFHEIQPGIYHVEVNFPRGSPNFVECLDELPVVGVYLEKYSQPWDGAKNCEGWVAKAPKEFLTKPLSPVIKYRLNKVI